MLTTSLELQSLEDEYPELDQSQVLAALQQAGGDLAAAQALCSRLTAAGSGCSGTAVEPADSHPRQRQQQQRQQRHWWPKSDLCVPTTAPAATPSSRPSSSSSGLAGRPHLVPHQVLSGARGKSTAASATAPMQPATVPRAGQPGGSANRQSPATVAIRRLVGAAATADGGSAVAAATSSSGASAMPPPGLLARSGSTTSSSKRAAAAVTPSPQPSSSGSLPPEEKALHPHYAAVFLTDASRQALLQHVAPLHEDVSADHMTIGFKPAVEACLGLPLGREAALFIVGVAADYRAQAVAVQHPSWVPFLSDSTPHVTVSVADDVKAKEAGDLAAAALETPGAIAPVARLKLLQGVVGVQLSDGRRVFSAAELQEAMAAAAAQARKLPVGAPGAGPVRILQRGQAPPPPAPAAAAVPAAGVSPAAAEQAMPPTAPSSSSKAAPWDLDALLDQLHMAEPAPAPTPAAAARSSRSGSEAMPTGTSSVPAAVQPRRGLLKLPAAVAGELAAPRGTAAPTAAAPGSRAGSKLPVLVARRPQAQQAQQQAWDNGGGSSRGGEWVEPAAPVFGKSVEEEAAEAAAGEGALDMVSSLAFLLPPERPASGGGPSQQQRRQQQQLAAAAPTPQEPPLPSPKMLAGTSSSSMGDAAAGVGAGGNGYDTSGSSTTEEACSIGIAPTGAAAAGPVDPESKALLVLQYPRLHELVVETALHMHAGSLEEAARFLAVLEQQQELVQPLATAAAAPAQATLGSFLQHVLPEAAAPAYDLPPSSGASSLGESGAYYLAAGSDSSGGAAQRPRTGRGGVTAGWQQAPPIGGGGGRGRGKAAARRSSGTAGDDPMSVTERQAMNTHLQAKRVYIQAAEEAFARGQVALSKELQATARGHGEAASVARRRANVSAFRSTNAAVMNTFTLDLHGQHVDEALASLERYLVTLGGLGHPGGVLLQVITGVGRHSAGNQPRVLPAVVRFLSDAGYAFDAAEGNAGVLNVRIGC